MTPWRRWMPCSTLGRARSAGRWHDLAPRWAAALAGSGPTNGPLA